MNKKFNINRPQLSDEQILAHKDFDAVLKGFEAAGGARPALAKWWLAIGISAVVVGIAAVSTYNYLTSGEQLSAPALIEATEEAASEEPALLTINDIQVPFESHYIDPRVESTLQTASGTAITIPADAFIDQNGQPLNSQVEIKILGDKDSRIAMHTLFSEASETQYQSDWECHIEAYANGQKVQLAKSVEIGFTSSADEEIYHVNLLNADHSYVASPNTPVPSNLVKQTNAQAPEKPVKPMLAREDNFLFTMNVDPEKFPELKRFTTGMFAVNTELYDFDPILYEIAWSDIKLENTDVPHNYEISLIKKDTTIVVPAYQVFSQAEYEKEMEAYEEATKDYNKQLAATNGEASTSEPNRTFETTQLGSLAYEKEVEMQDYQEIELKIVDGQGKRVNADRFFLAAKDGESLLSYNTSSVLVDPGAKYQLWATTVEGYLLVTNNSSWYTVKDLQEEIVIKRVNADAGISALESSMK